MSDGARHYRDMKMTLRRLGVNEWLLTSECDGQVVSSGYMYGDETLALSRAETLAGWFDAELKLIGESRDSKGGGRG